VICLQIEDTVHCSESDDESNDDSDGVSAETYIYIYIYSDRDGVREDIIINDDDEVNKLFNIPMVVTVCKGAKLYLEFIVNASPDNISTKGFSIKESIGDEVYA
jgi:hypothetical protein